MATVIDAAELAEGDVYRSFSGLRVLEADAYQVTAIRTVNYGAAYQIVEAVNLRTGLAATIHLRTDVAVAKLEPITHGDAEDAIGDLAEGQSLTIVRAGGRFWA